MDIFTTSPGYAGFYGPTDDKTTAVSLTRAGTPTTITADNGFLVDGYQASWQRGVQVKRVFNNGKPIAIVGYGTGSLTLQGLLGTYEGFKTLIGTNTDTNADICSPLICTIEGGAGFSLCNKEGQAVSSTEKGLTITCTGLILASIQVTGQIQENGTQFQQATCTFSIAGFSFAEKK